MRAAGGGGWKARLSAPIFARMGYYPKPASPRAFLADLRAYLADQGRFRLVGAAIAVGMTSLIVTGFIVESRWGVEPEGPQIVYAADWKTTRTDAEIVAQQKIDQKAAHEAKAARRAEFQKLADAFGIK